MKVMFQDRTRKTYIPYTLIRIDTGDCYPCKPNATLCTHTCMDAGIHIYFFRDHMRIRNMYILSSANLRAMEIGGRELSLCVLIYICIP